MSCRSRLRCALAAASLGALVTAVPTPSALAAEVPLRLVAQNVNVALDRQMRFVVAVDDATVAANLVADRRSTLRVVLHRPVVDRAGVRGFADGTLDPGVLAREDLALERLPRGANGEFVAILSPSSFGRAITTGLLPVSLIVATTEGPVARVRTFLNLFDPEVAVARLPVSVVVGFDAPVLLRPDGTRALDEGTRARLSRLLALLESEPAPYSLHLPPELLDGLGRLGEADLVARLAAVIGRHALLPATFVPTASPGADRGAFEGQHAAGLEVLGAFAPPGTGVWYSRAPVDATGLGVLASLGYDRVVLASATAETRPSNSSRAYGVNGAGASQVRFTDRRLADALAAREANPIVRATTLVAEILAEHTELLAAGGNPALRHVVLSTPTGEPPEPALLNPLGIALLRAPQLSFIPLSASPFDDTGPTRVTLPTVEVAESNRGATLAELREELGATASLLPADSVLRDEWRRSWFVAGSTALADAQFVGHVRGLRARLRAQRESILVASSTTFTLGGRESDIRLQVRNDSVTDVSVVVELRSAKLQFPDGARSLVVPAGSVVDLVVPVIARANGTFPLEIRLLTPEGGLALGPPTVVTARVTALAGLGQLITGIALVLLASWWYSHWRRRRLEAAAGTTLRI